MIRYISQRLLALLPMLLGVGNIVVGGAGKTPVALKIGKILIESGYSSC